MHGAFSRLAAVAREMTLHVETAMPTIAEEFLVDRVTSGVVADRKERGRVMPSLAAFASVHEALEHDLARELQAGDLVDARHASFAPLSDVFTCDKRNEGPVRRALESAKSPCRVFRCGRLHDVAAFIAEASGQRGSSSPSRSSELK